MPKSNTPKTRRGNAHLYLGKAGHLRVMSEFLLRGYNVAVPEVDLGDDIYVVQDTAGTKLWKIQVKTSTASPTANGYFAIAKISVKQLKEPKDPELTYIIVIRYKKDWAPYIIIKRPFLNELFKNEKVGTQSGQYIIFRFSYDKSSDTLKCGKKDISDKRDDWDDWRVIVKSAPKPKTRKKK